MKKLPFYFLAATVLLLSCKKEDTSNMGSKVDNSGSGNELPPPGFMFPKVYFYSAHSTEFKAWVNNTDVTSSVSLKTFFDEDPSSWKNENSQLRVKLVDQQSILIQDMSRPNENLGGKYFFRKDTLWATLDGLPIEIPLFRGNYSQIRYLRCVYKLTGKDIRNFNVSRSGTDLVNLNESLLLSMANDEGLVKIDTLAYYNIQTTYR